MSLMAIKGRVGYLFQHRFARDVFTLQAGSFAGTVFQAFAGILIARMLQPELFGVYSLVFSLASLGGILLGAGTQEAVSAILGSAYARNSREEVVESLSFLLKLTFYAGLVTAIIVPILPLVANHFYGNSDIGWLASVVILGVFLSSSFTATIQLCLQVIGKIRTLTFFVFGDQFLRFGFSTIFVYLGFGIWGAVLGQLTGASILFVIGLASWDKIRKDNSMLPSSMELLRAIKNISIIKYLNFSIWVAIDRNMGNLYMSLPIVITGIYVSTGEVSFFKLAFGFVNLALSLLGPVSLLLNMEFPKMLAVGGQKLRDNFIKVSLYGLGLSSLLTLGAVIVSPLAFRILYGESFIPSVQYVFGLLIYGALFGIGIGLGPIWRAINKVKISILINTIILGIGIPVGILLIKNFGIWGSVIMVTFWFTLSHLISFVYLARKLKTAEFV